MENMWEIILLVFFFVVILAFIFWNEARKRKVYEEAAERLGLTFKKGGGRRGGGLFGKVYRLKYTIEGHYRGRQVRAQKLVRKKSSSSGSSSKRRRRSRAKYIFEVSLSDAWDRRVTVKTPEKFKQMFDMAKNVFNKIRGKSEDEKDDGSGLYLEAMEASLDLEGPEDSATVRRLRDEKLQPVLVDLGRRLQEFQIGGEKLRCQIRKDERPKSSEDLVALIDDLVERVELLEGTGDEVIERLESFESAAASQGDKNRREMMEALDKMGQ